MKTVVIIPDRGSLKGIVRKNVVPILGKLLLAWNIEADLASKFIDSVHVSI